MHSVSGEDYARAQIKREEYPDKIKSHVSVAIGVLRESLIRNDGADDLVLDAATTLTDAAGVVSPEVTLEALAALARLAGDYGYADTQHAAAKQLLKACGRLQAQGSVQGYA